MIVHSDAVAATACIESGHRVFVHGAMATPNVLLDGLIAHADRLRAVELTHLHTHGPATYAKPEFADSFRVANLFVGANMRPYMDGDRIRTRTNNSGGIQGGISNGENIVLRVAFKPTATILLEQKTVSAAGEDTTLTGRGRHDPCVLPRAVPMVEAMVALVLCDRYLSQKTVSK
jgi:hypothetical protein